MLFLLFSCNKQQQMDEILALLTNINRDVETLKKLVERTNDNVKYGAMVKKIQVRRYESLSLIEKN